MNAKLFAWGVGIAAMSASLGAGAAPVASDVVLTQKSPNRLYIDYKLSEPAVVTFDILTNGVSIGRELLENFTGDCRKVIRTESGRISWTGITHVWPDVVVPEKGMTAVVTAWATNAPPDYMIVDLANTNVAWYVKEADIPGGTVLRDEYKTTKLVMRRIHAKGETFRAGIKQSETAAGFTTAQTRREITFTNDYYMGVFELTQKQWLLVRELGSGSFRRNGDKFPACGLSYEGIRGSRKDYNFVRDGHKVPGGFFAQLRKLARNICFDLPTAAQWEFACRAGTTTFYNNGKDFGIDEVAWTSENWSGDATLEANNIHEVGLKDPNRWGLYDCLGNVWELCVDRYTTDAAYYVDGIEPIGPADGDYGFRCGGGCDNNNTFARSAMRADQSMGSGNNANGFRVWCECLAK